MKASLEEGMDKRRAVFIISVANQKGGVGKTTTVFSLAGAFAKLNKNVLLIDLDMQANLTISFGINPQKINRSISDVLFNSALPLNVSRETRITGVDLIPADKDMEQVERFLPLRPDYKRILSRSLVEPEKILNGIDRNPAERPGKSPTLAYYDFLIIDCPPSIGAITLNALIASHLLIIPTQPEYYSTYAINGMLTNVEDVRKQYNPELDFRLLITMFDRRNRIHNRMSERLRENFSHLLFNTNIGVDTQLRESSLTGLPITHFHPRSRSARQYQNLAEEILELSRV
jgi:chromosome partitioning protein